MAFFEWDERYSVGVMRLDSHHQHLVKLLNELSDALSNRTEGEVLAKMLYQLLLYTRVHFVAEEQMMLAYGYPESAVHKCEHDRASAQLEGFIDQLHAGVNPGPDVMKFFKSWLIEHVLQVDQRYTEFFRLKGVC